MYGHSTVTAAGVAAELTNYYNKTSCRWNDDESY